MKWFKPKFSVCKECGVHFEPATGKDLMFGDLCQTHRKPKMEEYTRKMNVALWSSQNWEKVEAMYLKEIKEEGNKYQEAFQKCMDAIARQQQSLGMIGASKASAGLFGLQVSLDGKQKKE